MKTVTLPFTPILSVGGAAATGDYVGTTTAPQFIENTLPSPNRRGRIVGLRGTDALATAACDMELWLFDSTFVAPTDNAAWAITDAEVDRCIAVIPVPAAKWYTSGNNKVYSDFSLLVPISLPNQGKLYYALVARGATPAWTAGAAELKFAIHVEQD